MKKEEIDIHCFLSRNVKETILLGLMFVNFLFFLVCVYMTYCMNWRRGCFSPEKEIVFFWNIYGRLLLMYIMFIFFSFVEINCLMKYMLSFLEF